MAFQLPAPQRPTRSAQLAAQWDQLYVEYCLNHFRTTWMGEANTPDMQNYMRLCQEQREVPRELVSRVLEYRKLRETFRVTSGRLYQQLVQISLMDDPDVGYFSDGQ